MLLFIGDLMTEYKKRCWKCGMIVTSTNYFPDKQLGGPCPKDRLGNHEWTSA